MASSRATRNLSDDIVTALGQLRLWRADGDADKIAHWAARLDYLLDRWGRKG